jgi:cobalt-precorrin-5B (C1)-methyltransferase
MIGKMVKTAQGYMTTHAAGNQVDFDFLADICREVGSPAGLVDAVSQANTGRHFLELCQAQGFMKPLERVVELALERCLEFIAVQEGQMELEVILIEFDGTVLARAKGGQAGQPVVTAPTLIERLSADPAHSYDEEWLMGQPRQGRVGERSWEEESQRRQERQQAKQARPPSALEDEADGE